MSRRSETVRVSGARELYVTTDTIHSDGRVEVQVYHVDALTPAGRFEAGFNIDAVNAAKLGRFLVRVTTPRKKASR